MKKTQLPARRLSPAVALVVAALVLTGCQSEVQGNLGESDVREMISVLSAAGIVATRKGTEEGKYSITVDRGDLAAATAELSRQGLPRQKFGTLGSVFSSDKLVSTPFEERVRFMHALNEELAGSITRIAGVVSARVHLMVPEPSPLQKDKPKPRAAVFIYKSPDAALSDLIPVVKNLVVNSLDGLEYENVEVAMFDAAPAHGGAGKLGSTLWNSLISLAVLGGIAVAILFAAFKLRQISGGTAARNRGALPRTRVQPGE